MARTDYRYVPQNGLPTSRRDVAMSEQARQFDESLARSDRDRKAALDAERYMADLQASLAREEMKMRGDQALNAFAAQAHASTMGDLDQAMMLNAQAHQRRLADKAKEQYAFFTGAAAPGNMNDKQRETLAARVRALSAELGIAGPQTKMGTTGSLQPIVEGLESQNKDFRTMLTRQDAQMNQQAETMRRLQKALEEEQRNKKPFWRF